MDADTETEAKVILMRKAFDHLRRNGKESPSPSDIIANPSAYLPASGDEPAAAQEPEPADAAQVPPDDDGTPVPPEKLAPLPLPGHPYAKAHSRLAIGPLTTLFFLPEGQLPDGFPYHSLTRIRVVPGKTAGSGPALLLRFREAETVEILVEGRNVIALCDPIGRHVIHWLRQHPTGHDDGTLPVFIRKINVTEVESDQKKSARFAGR